MLSLFSVPKPFEGRVGLIQRNALATWAALEPPCEIALFGDEPGVVEAAAAVGASHEPSIATTAAGTPRVDDLFARARAAASNELLCFVNADILLPGTLTSSVARIRSRFPSFVALGQCRNLDVEVPVQELNWSEAALRDGQMRPPGGIDYLVFSRDVYVDLPPFALGRAGFDNWLVWDARRRGIPVVDLTSVVTAVHQNHEYGHVEGGRESAYTGAEARQNIALAGGELRLYNIDDATHRLEARGLVRNPLAPVRRLSTARWLALRWGEARRAIAGRRGAVAAR